MYKIKSLLRYPYFPKEEKKIMETSKGNVKSNEITILCPALVLSKSLRVKEIKTNVNPSKKTIKSSTSGSDCVSADGS